MFQETPCNPHLPLLWCFGRTKYISKNFPSYPWNRPQTPNQQFMFRTSWIIWGFGDARGMLQGYVGVFLEYTYLGSTTQDSTKKIRSRLGSPGPKMWGHPGAYPVTGWGVKPNLYYPVKFGGIIYIYMYIHTYECIFTCSPNMGIPSEQTSVS